MIHQKIVNILYVDDYKTAVAISNLLESFYDKRIENITLLNEENFNNGGEMIVETEHFKWVVKKR